MPFGRRVNRLALWRIKSAAIKQGDVRPCLL
jgi:hypothetical protein